MTSRRLAFVQSNSRHSVIK